MCETVDAKSGTTDNGSVYYTEGYVKEITIKAIAENVTTISVEPASSFRLKFNQKEWILFVKECQGVKATTKESKGQCSREAILLQEESHCNVKIGNFDAYFLLMLKQTHSMVRFVLDEGCENLLQIVSIQD